MVSFVWFGVAFGWEKKSVPEVTFLSGLGWLSGGKESLGHSRCFGSCCFKCNMGLGGKNTGLCGKSPLGGVGPEPETKKAGLRQVAF